MIQTRPHAHKQAHHIELAMNTKTNRAEVTVDEETDDFPLQRLRNLTTGTRELATSNDFLSHTQYPTGTSVSIEMEGRYQKGRGSVDEFLELTAIANPHARITLVPPTRESAAEEDDVPLLTKKAKKKDDEEAPKADPNSLPDPNLTKEAPAGPTTTTEVGGVIIFPRGVAELPPETKEIQPHPKGIELGTLLQMLKDFQEASGDSTLYKFLQEQFCRVSPDTASDFCKAIGATSRTKVSDIEPQQAEKLYKEFQEAKLAPPPTDCLAPIGVRQLLAGLLKGVRAEFYAASSREAAVYRGRPFQIEAAIAFGGQLRADDQARVIRFANRVPLLFQQSACSSFKSVTETNWRNYDLQHPRASLPVGPLVIMIHMASVWVPFTSESKEAIADYDEIRKEMKLALMECGRKLGTYLRKRAKMKREGERRDVFQKYIGEIAKAVSAINNVDTKKLYEALLDQARKKTAIADLELDEDGKAVKEEDPADQEGVIVVASESTMPIPVDSDAPPVGKLSKAEAAALKVAAMAKDDEPTLLDVKPAKRQAAEKTRATKNTATKGGDKPAAKQASAKQTTAKAPPSRSSPTKTATEKPKMRLVNGKLVPVQDGPKLF
jgi:DNA topoisomerase-6 subunit B